MNRRFDLPPAIPEPQAPQDAPEYYREILRRVESINAGILREQERESSRDDDLAKSARSGSLGPDWQRVQQRIDLGQTSLEDVFSGADTTPSARALRKASQAELAKRHAAWQSELDDSDAPDNPLSEIAELTSQLTERLEYINRRLASEER